MLPPQRAQSSICTLIRSLGLAVAIAAACSQSPRTPTAPTPPSDASVSTPSPPPSDNPPGPPPVPPFNPTGHTAVVVTVGDIGECGSAAVALTARLVERIDGALLLSGDLAYMHGSPTDFQRCFEPDWGQFRHRWRPAPGNHEYETPGAAGYFQYFGAAAGQGGRSYYSFRAGDWLVLMLNSNIPAGLGSPQFDFVRSELTANRNPCTMAVWHHPLFTSGPNGPNIFMRDMWGLLYAQGADVVLAGHDHLYERFGKQDVDGRSDARGLRQFITGTGGARLYDFQRTSANSQSRVKAHGVLRLTLQTQSYDWAFLDTNGAIADAGADGCH